MILSPRKQFPSWIKKAGYETETTIIDSRLAAVDKLILTDELGFWLDISKLCLGIRVSGANINKFVETFSGEDTTFPLADNQNLLRHLASATLSIFMYESDLDIAGQLALSIITTTFFGQYDLIDFPYVVAYAKLKTQTEGINARNIDLDTSEGLLKGLETNFLDTKDDDVADFRNEEMNQLLSIVRNTFITNKGLKEEVNVLWWLFGEYMPAVDLTFQEININRMLFLAAHELAKQTVFKQPLRNSRQYLRKALEVSQKDPKINITNVFSLMQNITAEEKEYLLDEIFEKVSYQTPFLLAIKCAFEVDENDWVVHFKVTSNQADAKKDIEIVDLAEQLYREFILMRYA